MKNTIQYFSFVLLSILMSQNSFSQNNYSFQLSIDALHYDFEREVMIGLSKEIKKGELSAGISIGTIPQGSKGFGEKYWWSAEDYDYPEVSHQLSGFWFEYNYPVANFLKGDLAMFYKYHYNHLEHGGYEGSVTSPEDHIYTKAIRTQYRNGLGLSWDSRALNDRFKIGFKVGIDFRQESVISQRNTAITQSSRFTSPITQKLSLSYKLKPSLKEMQITQFRKGILLNSTNIEDGLNTTKNVYFTLNRNNTINGFGVSVYRDINRKTEDVGISNIGLTYYLQHKIKVYKKVNLYAGLNASSFFYSKGLINDKNKPKGFLIGLHSGLNMSLYKNIFIQAGASYTYSQFQHNKDSFHLAKENLIGYNISIGTHF